MEYIAKGKAHKKYEFGCNPSHINIFITGAKQLTLSLKKLLRTRMGIESVIVHLKSGHKLAHIFYYSHPLDSSIIGVNLPHIIPLFQLQAYGSSNLY